MKIYSMTATFGKLEHETLTLQPGLNIIEAPNEWGKSTWCAFLVNMLYGIETRAKTTKTALADKERYAPWSGSPMAGRIDLNWNGRDITIERRTKGRLIFGDFKAYETATGMDIPELNSANCGQQLLGVERSVFTRAGFLRLTDLPVTQDDSLRRRLNNLVTTGDESGTGDALAQTLKDLKNKCRYNRSGLLPQAEAERDQLRNQLADLHALQNQSEQIKEAQIRLEQHIKALENHDAALKYEASLSDARQVAAAEETASRQKERLSAMIAACKTLPSREEAEQKLQSAKQLQEAWMALQMESQMLPPLPEQPAISPQSRDIPAAEADAKKNAKLERSKKRTGLMIGIYTILAVAALIVGFVVPQLLVYMGAAAALGGVVVVGAAIICTMVIRRELQELYDRHPGTPPDAWIPTAQANADAWRAYEEALAGAQTLRGDLEDRKNALQQQITALTAGESLSDCCNRWAQTVAAWDALGDARRDLQYAEGHAQALRAMARTVSAPTQPDNLSYTAEETAAILTEARLKQRQLHVKLGQCQGQAEALGQEGVLRSRLDTLNRRIARLEDTYYALEMAQDALHSATTQLQRRFAPRISKRAQALFSKLTGGRYQRITLGEDLSLSASAENEDTLRSSQWRSDGTVDQLYLALRLAVAEELTPEAPLILDDALVRFDDQRLKTAMEILEEEAETKQVILFTCQGREKQLL